jgi:hypothetical protein
VGFVEMIFGGFSDVRAYPKHAKGLNNNIDERQKT